MFRNEDDAEDSDDEFTPLHMPRPPTPEQFLSYHNSWLQFFYLTLCTKPVCGRQLCDARCGPDDARTMFEQWTVLKMFFFFVLEVVGFSVRFVRTIGFALFTELPFGGIGVMMTIFMTHMAWFIIVKRHGDCCGDCYGGRSAFIIWAVWFGVEPLLLWQVFTWSFGSWMKLILYVPNFFLGAACVRLFFAPKTRPKTFSEKVKDTFVGMHDQVVEAPAFTGLQEKIKELPTLGMGMLWRDESTREWPLQAGA